MGEEGAGTLVHHRKGYVGVWLQRLMGWVMKKVHMHGSRNMSRNLSCVCRVKIYLQILQEHFQLYIRN